MGLFEAGRVCVKTAGRDARKKCVIVDILESPYVLIDGETRRRKCNISHLEPLNLVIDITAGAENPEVIKALEKEGIICQLKKESKKEPKPKPKKEKALKKKPKEKPAEKKIEKKKEEKPAEEKKIEENK